MPQRKRTPRRPRANLAADFALSLDADAMAPPLFRAWDRRTDAAILRAYATFRLRLGLKARHAVANAVPCGRAECLAGATCRGRGAAMPLDPAANGAPLPPCLRAELADRLARGDGALLRWALAAEGAAQGEMEGGEPGDTGA